MKTIDPGHRYELATLDGQVGVELRFVKRVGSKFPGNEAPGYAGTTSQEAIRALIARTKYVDNQISDSSNVGVLYHLRHALKLLETRAAFRRGDAIAAMAIPLLEDPEVELACHVCGHLLCNEDHDAGK